MSDPTTRFIDLVSEVGVDGIADYLVSAIEVEMDAAENDADAMRWKSVHTDATILLGAIGDVLGATRNTRTPRYLLTAVDGETVTITADEFFISNEEMVGTEVEQAIRALKVGEAYSDGGGAQPTWSIRRLP